MTDKTINECLSVLRMRCEDLGIVLTEEQTRQFEIYYNCMVEKNKVMNLTAITQPMEVVEKHYLDSLLVVPWHSTENRIPPSSCDTGRFSQQENSFSG